MRNIKRFGKVDIVVTSQWSRKMKFIGGGKTLDTGRAGLVVSYAYAHMMLCMCEVKDININGFYHRTIPGECVRCVSVLAKPINYCRSCSSLKEIKV